MKRKLLSLILAGVLFASAACSGGGTGTVSDAPAEEASDTAETDGASDGKDDAHVLDYADVGMRFTLTDDFDHLKGVFLEDRYDSFMEDYGLYYAYFFYVGMPKADYDAFIEKEDMTDEEMNAFTEKERSMGEIWGVKDGDTPEKAYDIAVKLIDEMSAETEGQYKPELFQKVGQSGDVTYYYVKVPEETSSEGLDGEYKTEYETLSAALDKVIANGEFFEPVDPYADLIGKKLSFETTDLDGNTVKSEELFSQHKVTMLNVWATWCTWCVEELPQLEEINNRLADKDCAVVGILGDAGESGKTEEGKQLLSENGDTYLNLVPWESFEEDLVMKGWPTSFFVDSEGRIAAAPVEGADVEAYEDTIDAILSGDTAGQNDKEASDADNADAQNAYRIMVTDEDKAPVEGATVQFCSEDACFMGKTDAEGIAAFDNEPGIYTVHILAVPDGFEKNEEEYKTTDTYGDVQIVLNRS